MMSTVMGWAKAMPAEEVVPEEPQYWLSSVTCACGRFVRYRWGGGGGGVSGWKDTIRSRECGDVRWVYSGDCPWCDEWLCRAGGMEEDCKYSRIQAGLGRTRPYPADTPIEQQFGYLLTKGAGYDVAV